MRNLQLLCIMWYDGSFLKLNCKMLMKWLSEQQFVNIIISYSETAEDENTVSVVRALVSV